MPHNVIVQIPAIAEFQDEIKFGLRVDNFVETNDIRMLDQLHTAHFLEEMRSWYFIQLGLVNHFDGHFFASENVSSKFHDRKMAPTFRQ